MPARAALSELPNPYEFASPITRPERLAGRRSELSDIRYYLRHARHERPVNLALVGERAAGKTSLLNIIDHEAKQLGLLTARINLTTGDADPTDLFGKIYEAVVDAVISAGHLFQPGSDEDRIYHKIMVELDPAADNLDFPLRFPAHYAGAVKSGRQISEPKLMKDLETLRRACGTACVLLFDECDVLKERVALEMLRNVFMNTPGYQLVLTGTPGMFPLFDDVFSPIIRQFKKIHVDPFRQESETESCLRGPLDLMGLPVDDLIPHGLVLTHDVHELSGGRPYEIQLLGHLMFKMVQERKAEFMALSANVLDDVLRELDIAAPPHAGSRPIVEKVRKLGVDTLRGMGLLTACIGHANLDEMMFAVKLNELGPSELREALPQHFADLCAAGLLAADEDGPITFCGDEFEKVYVSYLAKSKNVSFRVQTREFSDFLASAISSSIDEATAFWAPSSVDGRLWVEDTISSLLPGGDPELRSRTPVVYEWVLAALGSGRLVLDRVTAAYKGTKVVLWVPRTDIEEGPLDDVLKTLEVRAGALGGSLRVEQIAYDLPSEEEFLRSLATRPNRAILASLGDVHAHRAFDAYTAGRLVEVGAELDLALRFPVTGDNANNIGYMLMSLGRLDEARRWLEICLTGGDTDGYTRALAHYNLAVTGLALDWPAGEVEKNLAASLAAIGELQLARYEAGCLFGPERSGDGMVMVERLGPDIREMIDGVRRFLGGVRPAVTGFEHAARSSDL
ncbi:hypothetical protein ACTI_57440 [Actinoplanes sp. OR16]|uniref:ATP-binding protein n=1 Tax=Actinoplanes sp. OR16 TaxID=946334 RepID=UPI000F6E5065|nr:ATP-binding protein [Actinoplanes sp. OR16]BBH69059.1 hypothetical protein ACTI_57440 [Actinoplanes sp. OR16]